MAIPDYQSLMLPVLSFAAEGETRVPLAAEIIADRLKLSPAEREEMLPSGRQRLLHNRVHWAKFYMSKAGLVESPKRGVFVATSAGRALLASSPDRIDLQTLLGIPVFAEYYQRFGSSKEPDQSAAAEAVGTSTATPEEQIDAAYAVLTKALKADLLMRVVEQSPAFFERLIVELLVGMGYGGSQEDAARQLGRSGDGGVDGVIDEDRLGLDRIYVQAKRYGQGSVVGRPDVQGFVGSLVGFGANKGVFVTTSTFSRQAVEYAKGLQQRVILIDGERLSELMIEFGVGVRLQRTVQIKRLDEDFFADET